MYLKVSKSNVSIMFLLHSAFLCQLSLTNTKYTLRLNDGNLDIITKQIRVVS